MDVTDAPREFEPVKNNHFVISPRSIDALSFMSLRSAKRF